MAGIGYFLWFWISYGIFYGIAGSIGARLALAAAAQKFLMTDKPIANAM